MQELTQLLHPQFALGLWTDAWGMAVGAEGVNGLDRTS